MASHLKVDSCKIFINQARREQLRIFSFFKAKQLRWMREDCREDDTPIQSQSWNQFEIIYRL